MKLSQILSRDRILVTDGAMGTYYSEITGDYSEPCEMANIHDPATVKSIHQEYIAAGAELLRTNTFSADLTMTGGDEQKLKQLLSSGFILAQEAAQEKAAVCADISSLYGSEDKEREYRLILDEMLRAGAENFIFETLPDLDSVLYGIRYIKQQKSDAEILVSFTVLPDGRTRSGVSIKRLAELVMDAQEMLTAVGLNCGCGAAQLYPHADLFFSYIREHTKLFTVVMPNAGYPMVVNRRTLFNSAPGYFASQTAALATLGVSALGGCCGTTPEYISVLKAMLNGKKVQKAPEGAIHLHKRKTRKSFSSKLVSNDFVIAAELDPPNTSDFSKLIAAAQILADSGVDIITVSDSPLGHAKADPVVCSARIRREVGLETLPHLCCRDRNINALRSILLGAHSEGIRSVLAVTGDHIAETDRGIVKPVFNLDSTRLMSLVEEMNNDVFSDAPIAVGCAFDPGVSRPEVAVKRLDKKIACGAKFVLTQPVFTTQAIECIQGLREKNIRVYAGIMPMVSYRNASFMKNEVPGMTIPEELVNRFRPDMTKEEARSVGIEIAVELAEQVIPYCDGLYFITPFNRAEIVGAVIERLQPLIGR